MRTAVRWACWTLGFGAVAAATSIGVSWFRYGHPSLPGKDEADSWLELFMPEYDVAERHHVQAAAPASITLAAAADTDLLSSPVIRGIIKARERLLGAEPDAVARPRGLLAEVRSLGWGVLAEVPGREIVVGAVTQPWQANVVFRALPPDAFAAFSEPGFVKIIWTLRADPLSPTESMFRTETRVVTTDMTARRKFRWYWARFSPGIVLIRLETLRMLKREAEGRARAAGVNESGHD